MAGGKFDMTDYLKGKIDGVKEFAEELKNHSCFYDLEEYTSFSAVSEETINKVMGEIISKISSDEIENTHYKNCLNCANSVSQQYSEGDILRCMFFDGKIVDEDECCGEWN